MKSDNGTEYINHNLIEYLKANGINFIHSVPGYPQQNGRAERLNQTLNYCTTTLLNSAKLSIKFWDSAVLCASYLYDINPHQCIHNKIPDEVFFNKPIDISHLKVFGCKAFFYNNRKTNKFDNNTKPGIFLGYANDSLGYKILDISTNSIISARDVYFIEDMPGTINTTFFCDKYIDSLINFRDLLIDGENPDINSNFNKFNYNPDSNNDNNIKNKIQIFKIII